MVTVSSSVTCFRLLFRDLPAPSLKSEAYGLVRVGLNEESMSRLQPERLTEGKGLEKPGRVGEGLDW